jgi:hypothetical protein
MGDNREINKNNMMQNSHDARTFLLVIEFLPASNSACKRVFARSHIQFRLQTSVCSITRVKAFIIHGEVVEFSTLANKCLHNPVSRHPSQSIVQSIQQHCWTMGAQMKGRKRKELITCQETEHVVIELM